jgi:hypothetical protein
LGGVALGSRVELVGPARRRGRSSPANTVPGAELAKMTCEVGYRAPVGGRRRRRRPRELGGGPPSSRDGSQRPVLGSGGDYARPRSCVWVRRSMAGSIYPQFWREEGGRDRSYSGIRRFSERAASPKLASRRPGMTREIAFCFLP